MDQQGKSHLKHGAESLAELKPTQPDRHEAVTERWLVGKEGREYSRSFPGLFHPPDPGTMSR